MSNYRKLQYINDIQKYTLNDDIQDGLVEYFDWALLDIGNYFNVTVGEESPDGNDYSRLRQCTDSRFSSGQAWEGFRSNWVWQSGISFSPAPLVGTNNDIPGITGVYVNDVFYPSDTTGSYAHHVDYYNGRVIFDSPISTSSKVQAEFSYKWVNVVYANSVPWLREIQTDTLEPNSEFYDKEKGDWVIPNEARLQLPAIAIEVVPNRTFKGYQLGGGQWVYTDVLFHCIAEDEITRNKLVDLVSLQSNKQIMMFNSNQINEANAYPLDYRGSPNAGALRYPDIVDTYPLAKLRISNSIVQNMNMIGPDIFGGIVRFTTEYIGTNI